jgi:hypothetical protein
MTVIGTDAHAELLTACLQRLVASHETLTR